MSIKYSILNETNDFEKRVGLTPDVASRLLKTLKIDGLELLLEAGAGDSSYYSDSDFNAVGVKTVSRDEVLKADYVGFISRPSSETIKKLSKGQTALGLFGSFSDESVAKEFEKQGVVAIDLNKLPRQLSMAQSMDAMTSQQSVAGYKAVLSAASEFAGFFPMLTTAAGTIKPAAVLILGAGIAGLQAIGTARRLGAVVTAFDVRPASREEVESLGGKFLDLGKYGGADVVKALSEGQGEGGYARALTPEELAQQKSATDQALSDFDIIITTAQVPGRKPPEFISSAGLNNLKPGSVVIDLAASDLGGNVEGSKPEKTVLVGKNNAVKLIGAPTLASSSPKASSNLLARNLADVFAYFADKPVSEWGDLADMVIAGAPQVKEEIGVLGENPLGEGGVSETEAKAEGSEQGEGVPPQKDDEVESKKEEK